MQISANWGMTRPVLSQPVRFAGKPQKKQRPTWSENNAVRSDLQQKLQKLGPQFAQHELIERWYEYDHRDHSQNGQVYFEWRDRNTLSGMLPAAAAKAIKRIPGLRPAAKALVQLARAGYKQGFPNPENMPFVNAIQRDQIQKTLKPGEFYKNVFAYTLPSTSRLSPQRTYLVSAEIDYSDYHDHLSYLYAANGALERRLKALGIPDASPSVRAANSPGISTELITEGPWKGQSQSTYTILIDYKNPDEYRSPTESQIKAALAKMPELVPASQLVDELKKSKYDGYYEKGKYPDDVYALDFTKLPGFKADSQYPKHVLVQIYNSSDRTIVKPEEQEVATYLNKALIKLGVSGGCVGIQSDNGPQGPNYLTITMNGYSPPQNEVMGAIAKMPALVPNSQYNAMTALLGSQPAYHFEFAAIPELAHLKIKSMPVRLFENITDGY